MPKETYYAKKLKFKNLKVRSKKERFIITNFFYFTIKHSALNWFDFVHPKGNDYNFAEYYKSMGTIYETGANLVFCCGRGVKNVKWVCHRLALSRQEDQRHQKESQAHEPIH